MYSLFLFVAAIEDHSYDEKFEEIYDKYKLKVFSIAYGITKNLYDADEAFQNAFFAIARNISRIDFSDETNVKVYIYKAAKSASCDIVRKNKRMPKTTDIDLFLNTLASEDEYVNIEEKDIARRIEKYILKMSEVYRDVLTYRLLYNYSFEEISDLLHRPIETVKSQYNRGRKMLTDAFKELK